MNYQVPNLLGLNPINRGIECRCNENIDIGQKNVNMEWNVVSKPLSENWEDPRSIKEDDDTDMGATYVESLWGASWEGMWRTAWRIGIYETKISTTSKTKVDIRTKHQTICSMLNCSDVFNSSRPHGLYSPWNSPGQNTGVDSHFLLQRFVGYQCRKCLPGQCLQAVFGRMLLL